MSSTKSSNRKGKERSGLKQKLVKLIIGHAEVRDLRFAFLAIFYIIP